LAAVGPILAIDLGRYKSVACADDRSTRPSWTVNAHPEKNPWAAAD
jgi:hypothetical protein